LDVNQFITILLTAVITAGATNLFGYWKEKKFKSSQYTEKTLTELYIPIYKKIYSKVEPGDGFVGFDEDDVDQLVAILMNKPELFDPKLEKIIYGLYEISYENWKYNENQSFTKEENALLEYIEIAFNRTRRNLGLPFKLVFAYPILYKAIKFRKYLKNMRIERKIQKKVFNNKN
jgi:hypothetical protein